MARRRVTTAKQRAASRRNLEKARRRRRRVAGVAVAGAIAYGSLSAYGNHGREYNAKQRRHIRRTYDQRKYSAKWGRPTRPVHTPRAITGHRTRALTRA